MKTYIKILITLAIGLTALGFSLAITGINVALSGEKGILKYVNLIENVLSGENSEMPENLCLIDISYDRTMVPVVDHFGMPLGTTDITDRAKLYNLLSNLNNDRNYRYILLDVFFDSEIQTPDDSALFALISQMPSIIVPTRLGERIAEGISPDKTALGDYVTTADDDFIKYPAAIDGNKTIAVKMYEDCTGNKVKRRNIFPDLRIHNIQMYDKDLNKNILTLGTDMAEVIDSGLLDEFTEDKFIIIGSFYNDDIHNTFRGNMPGPLIHFNVFDAMMRGTHRLTFIQIVLLFIIFCILGATCVWDVNPVSHRHRFLRFLLSLLTYSAFLSVVCIIWFYCFHSVIDIILTAILFEGIKFLLDLNNKTYA